MKEETRFDFERFDEIPERFRILKGYAHSLAMLAMQSDRYVENPEFKEAVDQVLEITFRYPLSSVPPIPKEGQRNK